MGKRGLASPWPPHNKAVTWMLSIFSWYTESHFITEVQFRGHPGQQGDKSSCELPEQSSFGCARVYSRCVDGRPRRKGGLGG